MRDGEASVGPTLWHHTLGPNMHCEVRPIVFASGEFVPLALELLLPGLVLWHKPPDWGHRQNHAVIERRVPQWRHTFHLFKQNAQLLNEKLLSAELLALGGFRGVSQSH